MPFVSGASRFATASVVLGAAAVDIHAIASYFPSWNAAYDDTLNYNTLSALPAGLGLTVAIDGSSPDITTTVAGVWFFGMQASLAADATAEVKLSENSWGLQVDFSPRGVPAGGYQLHIGEVVTLPSGAVGKFLLGTVAAATANPYNAAGLYATIARLA